MTCRRIINLCCISAIYANRDTTEVQDIHFRPMLKSLTRRSLTPLSLLRPSHSLWLMEVGLFIKNALFGQQLSKIAQNIFINNLKTAFCPCHSFFSLPNALNHRFSCVQNLYRFESVVFKRVLWFSVLGYTKRLPHACHMNIYYDPGLILSSATFNFNIFLSGKTFEKKKIKGWIHKWIQPKLLSLFSSQ